MCPRAEDAPLPRTETDGCIWVSSRLGVATGGGWVVEASALGYQARTPPQHKAWLVELSSLFWSWGISQVLCGTQ